MKAILEFNLEDEFDKEAHRQALDASKYILILDDIRETFRQHRKYDGPELTEDRFWEIINERGIEL